MGEARQRRGGLVRRSAALSTLAIHTVAAPFGFAIGRGLLLLWRRDPVARARRMQRVVARAFGLSLAWGRVSGLVDARVDPAVPTAAAGPCVVVANHPTLLDITALTASLGGGVTIVKPALHRRRLLRPFLDGGGHVAGAGGDPAAAGRVVAEAVARVRQGFPLVIFPEGTRSFEGRLRPFGRTAFEIACRADVPVVSATIECEPVWLSKEVAFLDLPAETPRLRVRLLAVDRPADHGGDSRRLRDAVEARFRAWHADPRLAAPSGGS